MERRVERLEKGIQEADEDVSQRRSQMQMLQEQNLKLMEQNAANQSCNLECMSQLQKLHDENKSLLESTRELHDQIARLKNSKFLLILRSHFNVLGGRIGLEDVLRSKENELEDCKTEKENRDEALNAERRERETERLEIALRVHESFAEMEQQLSACLETDLGSKCFVGVTSIIGC